VMWPCGLFWQLFLPIQGGHVQDFDAMIPIYVWWPPFCAIEVPVCA